MWLRNDNLRDWYSFMGDETHWLIHAVVLLKNVISCHTWNRGADRVYEQKTFRAVRVEIEKNVFSSRLRNAGIHDIGSGPASTKPLYKIWTTSAQHIVQMLHKCFVLTGGSRVCWYNAPLRLKGVYLTLKSGRCLSVVTPSTHETLSHCWSNVGSASQTVVQH